MNNNYDKNGDQTKVGLLQDGSYNLSKKYNEKPKNNVIIIWLILFVLLSIVLFSTLVFSFIQYRMCQNSKNIEDINKKLNNENNIHFDDKVKCEYNNKNNNNINDNELLSSAIWNHSRLPDDIIPYYYELNLRIDVKNMIHSGNCIIYLKCHRKTNLIILHAESTLMVNVTPTVYWQSNSQVKNYIKVMEINTYPYFSYFIIKLESYLIENYEYNIHFSSFHSKITNNLKGIYSSSYNLPNGTTRYIVVSQLQPLEARRIFPCFDEPIFKAKFRISIEHQSEFTALSNMHDVEINDINRNWKRTKFEVTPIMSTYILAFIVCDFKPVSTIGPNGLKIRVWTRDSYKNNTKYALDVIPKIYEYFEEYFNVSEVVTKSDHFAAPDFSAGAMENWGLVIYRESLLLYDEQKSLLEDEFMSLLVIAHEISHSWFGNMVTLKWWDNVWLNEAFATTLMYFAMDKLRPDFHVFDSQVVHDVFSVMEKDSLVTSHPILTTVEDPKEVQQYFDGIAYEKGLSVLRMMRGFLGDENFQRGLRLYIKKYMFSNSDMEELWNILTEAASYKYNVSHIMNSWLTQEGFPVVHLTREINKDYLNYKLTQEYFLLYDPTNNKKKYRWVIPFTYKLNSSNNISNLVWLNYSNGEIRIPIKKNNDINSWILGNIDFMGYYRVNYETENWLKLIHQLKTNHYVFTPSERASLIYDAFTFARVGYIDYSIPLNLSSYLKKEKDYVPWEAFFKSLKYIEFMLSTSRCYGALKSYILNQLKNIYYDIGWLDNGSFLERLLRVNVIKYSAYNGLSDAISEAQKRFKIYLQTNKIEKHLSEVTLCVGIQYNTYSEWELLFNKSLNAVPAEQNVIWQSLVCNKDLWVLWKFLRMTMNETIIKKSEIKRIFGHYTLTPLSRYVVFQFVLKYWNKIIENFGNEAFFISSILEAVSIGVNSQSDLDRLKQILAQGSGVATNAPKVAVDLINSNIQWMNKHEDNICEILQKQIL